MTKHQNDPLGLEADRRKRTDDADPDAGPSVAGMASTHGTVFAADAEDADRLASDETDQGIGSDDGLGNPPPIGQGDGR